MDKSYKMALNRIQESKRRDSNELILSGLKLTQFPIEICELNNITVLDLSNNQLTTIPEDIGKLTNLTVLNLSSNKLTAIPEDIGELTKLTSLSLLKNQLTTLPESIGNLTKLTSLFLNENLLTTVPKSIDRLTKLTTLYLWDNQLTTVPEALGKLTSLIELSLSMNQLTKLPELIGKLTNLTILILNGNQLATFPEVIEKLTELTLLDLSDNQLTTVPESIGKLTKLTELSLSYNQLITIPEAIGKLTNLTELRLSYNQLTTIPEAIGKLTRLAEFNLRDNQITNFPEAIGKLTKLNYLHLEDNLFEVGSEIYELPPKEQIKEILKWQKAQKAGTLQPIHEAKVIFIGESNYGKTHLIELLREGEINRKIKTTHGIERSQITIPYEEKDIRLNIWDLGGQEFMRSTHQFFFSERTLYVLVTLARRERNELNHWLKLAYQLGNKAPVLVVINKIDLDPHDIDRKSLERDYPNIIGFVRTCIKDCQDASAIDTIYDLKNNMTKIVSDKNIMPAVFEQRPPDWFMVKEELEKLEAKGVDFITFQEYENLHFIKDLPEDERRSNLKLLSMLGAVVSYVDDPRLIDTNVINPQWIMDGVYAIINDPEIKDERKGRLLINDLDRILPVERFPKERHVYLLELMQKFNLCYAAKDHRDNYFIPDLFEDIEPSFEWDSTNSLHFRYNYDDFTPNTFITRFIVEMNQDIQYDNRWRSGVHISNSSCQAKVYQAFRKNFIHIEILGNKQERRNYLYAIREVFRKLHKPFPEMKVGQEVLYKGYWLDYLRLVKLEEKNKGEYHIGLDEDLPITDILNGFSTPQERMGTQKIIEIFLASSSELKSEREQFEIFINRENNRLIDNGIYLKLELWEDFIDAMSKSRLQDEYNNVVRQSDIFVSLFFTKVGLYTAEEFETAFGQFKKTGKPLVYTYFKNASIDTENITNDIKSLLEFKEKLKNLGHYRTVYNNVEGLQLHFKKQIEKVLPNL